ncbi:hypothetical protein NLM33_44570 [Bradyrhizobium sp. CCGUVB1N3]|uniref:hypothetical protein n=1 Tax=Bradyrhizobium sp. CCGUVB1N3 TaxID=2949629 RepID=UPI0020B2EBB4|nr:hypothetical protein [Bradyrhizobium sp. CCGUVB1N3]MCP3477237.1 hypothetical protein [Bradyrhizobium sp. CCGUVB1N3]
MADEPSCSSWRGCVAGMCWVMPAADRRKAPKCSPPGSTPPGAGLVGAPRRDRRSQAALQPAEGEAAARLAGAIHNEAILSSAESLIRLGLVKA